MFDMAVHATGIARGASLEQCWEVISDAAGYKDWVSFFTDSHLVSEGLGEPNGIGSTRKFFDDQGNGFLEVVNIYKKPRLFGYHVIDPAAAVKDHQGVVTLTPVDGGTELTWFMSANNNGYISTPRDQVQSVMQGVIEQTIVDLVTACEARARR